jgi:hypothetical protein
MKAAFEAAAKYRDNRPEEIAGGYIAGWIIARGGMESIRLAIEKVGLENLSGAAVRDGLGSIRDFETGLLPPITLSNNHPYFMDLYRMCRVQQGKIVPISEWIETPWLPPWLKAGNFYGGAKWSRDGRA